ncbi:MAG: hypothetical protein AMXMBFR84_34830 [Candidatus Hydrogenedentota bacterium]
MSDHKLHPQAWVAFGITGLFGAAEALCSIFVSVYLWVNSHDLNVICRFHLAVFAVTPVFFVISGWYAQAKDRLQVYRFGLVLHAIYYGIMLWLQERASDHDILLGSLLGVAWGVFYAGNNTIHYDVTSSGRREYYYGILSAVSNFSRLVAPPVGGIIIAYAPQKLQGYHRLFMVVIVLYLMAYVLSFLLPSDRQQRPFHIKKALFPPKKHKDWRNLLYAAFTLAGSYYVLAFMIGLLMYMETEKEVSVGGFASFQALIAIAVSYGLGWIMKPLHRRRYLCWSAWLLTAGGLLFFLPVTSGILIAFGIIHAVSTAMFDIPHFSLRVEVIQDTVDDPTQRIEYLCAWEIPLAIGRVVMMFCMLGLSNWIAGSDWGVRITLFILCALRVLTYFYLARTTQLQRPGPLLPEPVAELEAKTPTGT